MANKEWNDANQDKLKKYRRDWYERNKIAEQEKARARTRANKAKVKAWYAEYKSNISCIACGEDEPICLDFHHINPSEKDDSISNLVRNTTSIKRIQKEIDKCVVLCSNCHRKVHAGIINIGD